MSKIRMALLKNCTMIGIAWLDKSGAGQAIKINIPRRKQEVIIRALKEGIDFPKSAPANKEEAPKIILPAGELLRQESEKNGTPLIKEF